jgi:threonine/homoserine/homoserine lactone efflux protein
VLDEISGMPTLTTLLLFAAAALSINFTPGPDMLYVIARSIGQGRVAGIVSALGLTVGYIIYTVLAASGLAALLLSSPGLFGAVRVIGAAYLAYLGVRTLTRHPDALSTPLPEAESTPGRTPGTGWQTVFRQGALTSTLNPSIAIFFLAFLPQFVEPERGTVFLQIAVLGLVFNTTATATHTVIALLTGTAGDWLRRRSGAARWQRIFSGVVLIVLGARVLLQGAV